ncbi:flagellar basal body-associated FliL family protein [Actibacterium lipolyticum]|uniref:Flagellar protein FliL n=1 Tax=Actibacterium lipolyticum TaxID=1524263 RepID=A0A238KYT6_9RHOB|nr:flagellar basal body-associated FliL family protein [Actibacterium lipolyticum]SMX47372.1 Flagellar FliL protein [Actibacterium lipolyticum]
MAATDIADEPVPKKSKLPLLIGLILALGLGAGAFFAVYSGKVHLPIGGEKAADKDHKKDDAKDSGVSFVALDPLIVSLGPESPNRHLKFAASVEVVPGHEVEVTNLMPRILDVLNSYLRAVDVADLETSATLVRLRAQMLRRIQIVTGEGQVRDLLITEFVLN